MNTAIDWSQCPLLESVPGKVSGAWVFKGTRVPVWAVMNSLKEVPASCIAEDYPSITPMQVEQLLDFIATNALGKGNNAIAA